MKTNWVLLIFLIIFYSFFIYSNRDRLFLKFNNSYIDKYLISQDILDQENKIKNRIFVSDEDIYIASGYLYTDGNNPIDYNFQHPPFVKYLFGLSSKYLGLPLLPNLLFSSILLIEIIVFGKLMFKNYQVGLLASLFLLFDPVFKEVTTYALLDLGQIVFIFAFVILSIFYQRKIILQGLLLGLALASKFYTPVLIFLVAVYLYKFLIKKINIKNELIVLAVSFVVFYSCYFKAWPYNIFYHQAKIFKFMLDHNHAINWGEVLKIFFGGYVVWPVLFTVNLFMLFYKKAKLTEKFIYLLPVLFLTIMTFQLPFTRYFIIILPFMYLALVRFILLKINYEK